MRYSPKGVRATARTLFFLGIIVQASCCFGQGEPPRYIGKDFGFNRITRVEGKLVAFRDTIPNDTLYSCFQADNFPCAYYREVFVPVCLDGACYPASVRLYWSPGGDHLGYSLVGKGIKGMLTKNDHEPFNEQEYVDLHRFLDDPHSVLKDYKLAQLLDLEPVVGATKKEQKTTENGKPDAVSGATIEEVKSYSVKGAVYTTFTLWHTVYGPTLDSIRVLSNQFRSVSFLNWLLKSQSVEDNEFALTMLPSFPPAITQGLLPKLIDLVVADDLGLKDEAIRVIMDKSIPDTLQQMTLLRIFGRADYATKLIILDQLKTYPNLPVPTLDGLIQLSVGERPLLVQRIMEVLKKRGKPSLSALLKLAEQLTNTNRFIADVAYEYLNTLNEPDRQISEKLSTYRHTRI